MSIDFHHVHLWNYTPYRPGGYQTCGWTSFAGDKGGPDRLDFMRLDKIINGLLLMLSADLAKAIIGGPPNPVISGCAAWTSHTSHTGTNRLLRLETLGGSGATQEIPTDWVVIVEEIAFYTSPAPRECRDQAP
jgi:hypothetical protein